jgi:uncharacterized protein
MKNTQANRLIHSTSPYLLQHAYNPVDWYEWGPEALNKAKQEDKPILVSIGYSSCHWCHVMERECFEKEHIAAVMNQYFVCIKVDREERPDIDQIYMDAVQVLGVNGGWPLNVFLTPDQKPFFGGTYFAPPNWTQVLTNIDKAFKHNRKQIEDTSEELRIHLLRSDVERFIQKPDPSLLLNDLQTIYSKLESGFDEVWGGMDKAPKFVMPSVWIFLLRYYHLTKNQEALKQLTITLWRIAMGGIYDQVGGGFSRYSVDAYWFAPHFEKMLYDNAQLLTLYSEAYALTRQSEFKTVVYETFEWLEREMTHPGGGFYSALDADSEGVEGKFYCWTKPEFDAILGDQADLVGDYYRVREGGNWEHDFNILMRDKSDEVFLRNHSLDEKQWKGILSDAKRKLLAARSKRVRPGLDDKIITSWNAMTISGLCSAFKAFRDQRFLHAAQKAMRFLENELMQGVTIYRSYKEKRSTVHAFLDDYAFVIKAYTDLYESTFDEYYLKRADSFTQYVLAQFRDDKDGFFFYTASTAEALITRKREIFDNVIPASNSVMALNLHHLGIILYRDDWKAMAGDMTGSLSRLILGEPNYMSQWAIVYIEVKNGMSEVVIIGKEADAYRAEFHQNFHPFSLTLGTAAGSDLPLVKEKVSANEATMVYVCYNKTCRLPVYTVKDAEEQLIPGNVAELPQS